MTAHELLSRVVGGASRSRSVFSRYPKLHSSMKLTRTSALRQHPSAFSVLMVFHSSSINLVVACLGEQFLSLRMTPPWATSVCTLVGTGFE